MKAVAIGGEGAGGATLQFVMLCGRQRAYVLCPMVDVGEKGRLTLTDHSTA
jgi:hypothetical protein